MIHRIALLIGGLTAAAVLAFSFVRGDRPTVDAAAGDPATQAAADGDATAGIREVVDTVYVAPTKRPKVVHVTRRVRARPKVVTTTTRHVRNSGGGEREHEQEQEHEGNDD